MTKVPRFCGMKKPRFEQDRRELEKFYHPTKNEKQKKSVKAKRKRTAELLQ